MEKEYKEFGILKVEKLKEYDFPKGTQFTIKLKEDWIEATKKS